MRNAVLVFFNIFSMTLPINAYFQFAVGYQRMQGKACLFPFGFHCTGMPIKVLETYIFANNLFYGMPSHLNNY